MFEQACKVGLEGVVSKVRDSRYVSGRGREWVKKTCAQRETLTITGFSLDGNDWDGIYVGRRNGDDLIYAGKVDHGFDEKSSTELRKRLTPLIRKTQPYTKRIAHKGIWVEPELLAEIEYRAQSAEGKVRHPFFRGSVRTYRWTISIASGNGQISRLAAGSPLPPNLHHAVTSLPLKEWYDRDKVNEAVRKLREAVDKNPTPHRP